MSTIGIRDSNQNPFTNLNSNQIRKSSRDYILTLKILSFLSFFATQRITYGISLQSTKLLHERDWPSKRKPYHLTMLGYTKPIHSHRGNNSTCCTKNHTEEKDDQSTHAPYYTRHKYQRSLPTRSPAFLSAVDNFPAITYQLKASIQEGLRPNKMQEQGRQSAGESKV